MTRDKTLGILFMVFFSLAGITVLILGWIQPMPASERILTTSAGSVGLLVALIQALLFRSARTSAGVAPVPVEVSVEDKP